MVIGEDLLLRKRDLLGVLERVCEGLELTESQFRLAKGRYEAVGAWLADASSPVLQTLAIYLQGSTAIGTTVKPINGDEHDVDLVAHIAGLGSAFTPASVKKAIGDRLRASDTTLRCCRRWRGVGDSIMPTNSIWTSRPRSPIQHVAPVESWSPTRRSRSGVRRIREDTERCSRSAPL